MRRNLRGGARVQERQGEQTAEEADGEQQGSKAWTAGETPSEPSSGPSSLLHRILDHNLCPEMIRSQAQPQKIKQMLQEFDMSK